MPHGFSYRCGLGQKFRLADSHRARVLPLHAVGCGGANSRRVGGGQISGRVVTGPAAGVIFPRGQD